MEAAGAEAPKLASRNEAWIPHAALAECLERLWVFANSYFFFSIFNKIADDRIGKWQKIWRPMCDLRLDATTAGIIAILPAKATSKDEIRVTFQNGLARLSLGLPKCDAVRLTISDAKLPTPTPRDGVQRAAPQALHSPARKAAFVKWCQTRVLSQPYRVEVCVIL